MEKWYNLSYNLTVMFVTSFRSCWARGHSALSPRTLRMQGCNIFEIETPGNDQLPSSGPSSRPTIDHLTYPGSVAPYALALVARGNCQAIWWCVKLFDLSTFASGEILQITRLFSTDCAIASAQNWQLIARMRPFSDAYGGADDDHDGDKDADVHENHLIAFVGGNMPARFDWADIRVLSTSVLLTNTC